MINIELNLHIYERLVKIEVMADYLYWTALDCTGVPNKVDTKCMKT